eukprot:UN03269
MHAGVLEGFVASMGTGGVIPVAPRVIQTEDHQQQHDNLMDEHETGGDDNVNDTDSEQEDQEDQDQDDEQDDDKTTTNNEMTD